METSYANGGQLSASNAEVWNRWPTILKALAWTLRRDAPLLLNPRPNWHKASWMAEFIWNIRNYEANTVATARLAIAARDELFAIAAHEGIDFDHQRRGILHLYRSRCDYEQALKVSALLKKGGLERRPVSDEEIHQIEPVIQDHFYGGFYTSSDSTGDIHKFTRGLAAVTADPARFPYKAYRTLICRIIFPSTICCVCVRVCARATWSAVIDLDQRCSQDGQ